MTELDRELVRQRLNRIVRNLQDLEAIEVLTRYVREIEEVLDR